MVIDPGRRDDEQKKKKKKKISSASDLGSGSLQLHLLHVSEDADVLKTRPQPRADLVTPLRFQHPLVLIWRLISFPTSSILFEECPPQHLHLKVPTAGISGWRHAPDKSEL